MKTTVISLQSHDFIVSNATLPILNEYVYTMKKATKFRKRMYSENMDALRDVLMEQGSATISKAAMARAINLVGVPDHRTLSESITIRFPRLHTMFLRCMHYTKKIGAMIQKHWQKHVAFLFAIGALFMGVGYTISAIAIIQSNSEPRGTWQTIETTIGRVRSYSEGSYPPMADAWLFSWQTQMVFAVLFLVLAISLVLFHRAKHKVTIIAAILVCSFALSSLWQLQRQATETRIALKTSWMRNTTPLEPHLAFLQQCGDEIQYSFDNQTAGMLFHSLRDDGFVLTAELSTNYGHPDLKQLCIEYNRLRDNHPAASIVLQNYVREADGRLRPYMFSDANDDTSKYGLFVKQ